MRRINGKLTLTGKEEVAIVVSRFNHLVTDRLVEGAIDTFVRHGGNIKNLTIIKAPGAFELPMVVKKAVESKRYEGICCLGAVIRGATPHFDYVAAEATKGIAQVGLNSKIPVTYGLLTTDTLEQAIERAGTKAGNKGTEAMLALIEMINLYSLLTPAQDIKILSPDKFNSSSQTNREEGVEES